VLSRSLITTFLGVLLVSSGAMAEDDYGRNGLYLGIDLTVGTPFSFHEKYDTTMALVWQRPPGFSDSSVGAGARLGYRFLTRFAVEAQFEWLSGFNYKIDNNQKLVTGNTYVLTGNAKGYLLDEGRLQPYLLVGAGYMRAKNSFKLGNLNKGSVVSGEPQPPDFVAMGIPGSSETAGGFAARFGAGFEAYATSWLGFNCSVSYVLPTADVRDLDYLSVDIGAIFRF
jgi:opacity protein-like surface antigen